MKRDHVRNLLEQSLAELASARKHLDFSFQQVAGLPDTLAGASEKQLESAEAFTGRFARSVDLLVNKVLRSLDRVELKTEGTLLDVVNRAEKRGFVNQSEELREMKDVRNIIAHDYAGAKAAEIFTYCREQKPVLDSICELWTHFVSSWRLIISILIPGREREQNGKNGDTSPCPSPRPRRRGKME